MHRDSAGMLKRVSLPHEPQPWQTHAHRAGSYLPILVCLCTMPMPLPDTSLSAALLQHVLEMVLLFGAGDEVPRSSIGRHRELLHR